MNVTTSNEELPKPVLTDEQKLEFMENGFIVVRNVVSKELTDKAKRAINRFVSRPATKEEIFVYRNVSYGDLDLMGSDNIRNLMYKSGVLSLIESLLGSTQPVWVGQIALRFPGFSCLEDLMDQPEISKAFNFLSFVMGNNSKDSLTPLPDFEKNWHIDGTPDTKFTPPGMFHNFTMLVGVLLSDVDEQFSGNLTVFPGSHKVLENYFKFEKSPEESAKLDFSEIRQTCSPRLNKPVQIIGKRGDVILAHYQTAHTVSPNVSSDIRYCVYFRVTCGKRDEEEKFYPEAMKNIWVEYMGVYHLFDETQNT